MRQQAFAIGQEFRQKGVNVCLGPVATVWLPDIRNLY